MTTQMKKAMGTWLAPAWGAWLIAALGRLTMAAGRGILIPSTWHGTPAYLMGPSKPSI